MILFPKEEVPQMNLRFKLVLAALACTTAAFATPGVGPLNASDPDAFQVRYFANLNVGNSYIDITNNGANNGKNICIQVYVFDKGEELLDCCSCTVTPNGLQSFNVNSTTGLTSNTLTGQILSQAVVKMVATSVTGCDAGTAVESSSLVSGMRAWATTLHQNTSTSAYDLTETEFSSGSLSVAEYNHITSFCNFIEADGTTQGICPQCTNTALGASAAQ